MQYFDNIVSAGIIYVEYYLVMGISLEIRSFLLDFTHTQKIIF